MNSTAIDSAAIDSAHLSSANSDFWTTAQGVVWAGMSVAILSGWFVVTRAGLRHDLRIWDVIALRFGEGAILLTPTLVVGQLRLPIRLWLNGIVLAALWGAPFILLVGIGLQATSATLTSSVTPALMPVFAGCIAWGLLGERPRRRQLCGYGLITAALLALVYGYVADEGRLDIEGMAALVAAAAMWALYALRFRRTSFTPLQAAALICFWSALLYLPFYIGLGLSTLTHASGRELLFQSLYQGVMMSVIAIFAFNRAVVLLGARAATAIIALVPVAASALAVPVLGEWPSLQSAAAICVIPIGVALSAVSANPSKIMGEKR